MSKEQKYQNQNIYYNIIDGSLRTKVDKDHPEAIAREYETRDGVKSVKYERKIDALTGIIEDIGFYDGEFGKVLNITLDENEEGRHPVIQIGVETSYGEDFLKRLPAIDLTQEVYIAPYAFTDEENGREVRGVSVMQNKVKIKNFFYDVENKKAVNGYPIPEGDVREYTKEDWKIFYLKARKFLIAYVIENVLPKFEAREDEYIEPAFELDKYDDNPNKIPFQA